MIYLYSHVCLSQSLYNKIIDDMKLKAELFLYILCRCR